MLLDRIEQLGVLLVGAGVSRLQVLNHITELVDCLGELGVPLVHTLRLSLVRPDQDPEQGRDGAEQNL